MTIKELAAKLADGTHFTTISKLERSQMEMTSRWIDKLSLALDVGVLELVMDEYREGTTRAIPLFARNGYPSAGNPSPEKRVGWTSTTVGGPRTFAALYLEQDNDNPLSGNPWSMIIDPDFTEMKAGIMYAIRAESSTIEYGVYDNLKNQFDLLDSDPVIIGKKRFRIIGAVVAQSRVFPWANSYADWLASESR